MSSFALQWELGSTYRRQRLRRLFDPKADTTYPLTKYESTHLCLLRI